MSSCAQRCKGIPRTDRELLRKQCVGVADRPSIAGRVRNQHEDERKSSIAELEGDASKLTLDIRDSRLGFDGKVAQSAIVSDEPLDDRVPRPLIQITGERDLGREPDVLREVRFESLEEGDLGRVADRVRTWIRPHSHVKSDCGAEASDLIETRAGQLRTLESSGL